MINLGYILRFGSCGGYCLKYICKRRKYLKYRYLSLYSVSEFLVKEGYCCSCVRVNSVKDILFECVTLIRVNEISYHYIILKRISDKYVYYYDPLFLFEKKCKINKFINKWAKVCLFYTKV